MNGVLSGNSVSYFSLSLILTLYQLIRPFVYMFVYLFVRFKLLYICIY